MFGLQSRLDRAIGDKSARHLKAAFEFDTVGDLLMHYPRRLDDRGELTNFDQLRVGEHATVLARTEGIDEKTYTDRRTGKLATRTIVTISDGQSRMTATFFRQRWRKGSLQSGTVALYSGKVDVFKGHKQLTHPHVDVIGSGVDLEEYDAGELRRWWPIYPATAKVSSKQLMDCVEAALEVLEDPPDPLPEAVRREQQLMGYAEALRAVHQPENPEEWRAARRRLRFDEALTLQTVLARRRHLEESLPATPRPPKDGRLRARFDASLPFELTAGQREIGDQLSDELSRPHPMHRLLQGEVGSGKTVVALRAMLQVVDAGGQAALLAPTEVLAAQHHRSVLALLGPMAEAGMLGGADEATRVVLLTGSTTAAQRRGALLDVASGAAGIVIGTHALLEEQVQFADLGLVVVDEQHRFGVEQRAALTGKGARGSSGSDQSVPPHVLVMTATPIPRTVAMTVFGDLEVSTLRELPLGRPTIQTTVVPVGERPDWFDRAWQRLREEVANGHQAYVVCPRIGGDPESAMQEAPPDEESPARRPPVAVADVAAQLVAGPLAGLRVYILHGRLPGEEKDDLMRRFAAGDIDVLVATTVIEVGVDVPNATVMVVMDADRFGVSQLHQLRGRIGRGTVPGLCLLVTDAPEGSVARDRLEGVAATTDGFELSRLDLENRREGDVLGASQSGRRSSLRLLSVLRDEDVIATARDLAQQLVAADPHLETNPALAAAVAVLEQAEQADFLEKS
jgi:ATP-dependent DNA helicase RecG